MHTRISEQLSDDIRRLAEDLRVPASNLVRNVLEEVFTVVDHVSGDVGELMDDVVAEAEAARERVVRQARARRRGAARRRARRADADAADVEEELRRDEAAEAAEPAESGEDARADESAPQASRRPRPAERFPDVLGWQALVLNRALACGGCERPLEPGESAFLGVTAKGVSEIALCGPCASGAGDRRGASGGR